MLNLLLGSIPREILNDVSTKLDAYCAEATQRMHAKGAESYQLFWRRRGNAVIISEQYAAPSGKLIRYDSGKFEFEAGLWRLFHIDVSQRWRRYLIAPATTDFDGAFRHWLRNETGIFSRADFKAVQASAAPAPARASVRRISFFHTQSRNDRVPDRIFPEHSG